MTEGELLQMLVEHDAWPLARKKLTDRILDLQSIKNIDTSDVQTLVTDIKARNAAVDILMEWLREIEGIADQHKNNQLNVTEEDSYVVIEK